MTSSFAVESSVLSYTFSISHGSSSGSLETMEASKLDVEVRSYEKPLARKRIFVQTPFSHSTLNLERKKIHAAKPLAFSLHFLFRRDQNHYSNLTSKIMKMCEQILKKKTAPQYNSNSLNCKNQEHRNIASLSLQLRSYKKQ